MAKKLLTTQTPTNNKYPKHITTKENNEIIPKQTYLFSQNLFYNFILLNYLLKTKVMTIKELIDTLQHQLDNGVDQNTKVHFLYNHDGTSFSPEIMEVEERYIQYLFSHNTNKINDYENNDYVILLS